jgi:non-heme chloroperoxidase
MSDRRCARAAVLILISLALPLSAQEPVPWRDPSPHSVQFVTVEDNVKLEVLDWGGSGRPIVLLTGSGNTAHVYDDFARKLLDCCHVYGITRRGFGLSSHPESGYTDQRLADDVLQVIDSLNIVAPVLVGHSMAGSELTTLGNEHSERLAGLVYLDAGDDPGDFSGRNPDCHALFAKLPASVTNPAPPSEADKKSFQAFHDYWQKRTINFGFPESELRNMYDQNPDGSVGPNQTPIFVRKAIGEGSKKRDYSKIRVPILAFFAVAPVPPAASGWSEYYRFQPKNDEERAALEKIYAADRTYSNRWENTMRTGVPEARIVELPGADHYVFFTNEAEVLRELRAFVAGLH